MVHSKQRAWDHDFKEPGFKLPQETASKPKYEKPILISMGQTAQGIGGCMIGSAATGVCRNGSIPSIRCRMGTIPAF
jgi:hypothetical protein